MADFRYSCGKIYGIYIYIQNTRYYLKKEKRKAVVCSDIHFPVTNIGLAYLNKLLVLY